MRKIHDRWIFEGMRVRARPGGAQSILCTGEILRTCHGRESGRDLVVP